MNDISNQKISDTPGTSPTIKIFLTPDSRNFLDKAPLTIGVGSSVSNIDAHIFKNPPPPSAPLKQNLFSFRAFLEPYRSTPEDQSILLLGIPCF